MPAFFSERCSGKKNSSCGQGCKDGQGADVVGVGKDGNDGNDDNVANRYEDEDEMFVETAIEVFVMFMVDIFNASEDALLLLLPGGMTKLEITTELALVMLETFDNSMLLSLIALTVKDDDRFAIGDVKLEYTMEELM